MLITPKLSMTIAGNAGGGAAAPDYEVMGLVGLKVKRNITLQARWRYLDVHYRNNSRLFLYDVAQSGGIRLFLYDVAQSGGIFGATFQLK